MTFFIVGKVRYTDHFQRSVFDFNFAGVTAMAFIIVGKVRFTDYF